MEILKENIRREFYVGNVENKISFYVFLSAGSKMLFISS